MEASEPLREAGRSAQATSTSLLLLLQLLLLSAGAEEWEPATHWTNSDTGTGHTGNPGTVLVGWLSAWCLEIGLV